MTFAYCHSLHKDLVLKQAKRQKDPLLWENAKRLRNARLPYSSGEIFDYYNHGCKTMKFCIIMHLVYDTFTIFYNFHFCELVYCIYDDTLCMCTRRKMETSCKKLFYVWLNKRIKQKKRNP